MRVRLCSNIRYCCLALFDGFEKNISTPHHSFSYHQNFHFMFVLRIDDNNHKVIKHNFCEIKKKKHFFPYFERKNERKFSHKLL